MPEAVRALGYASAVSDDRGGQVLSLDLVEGAQLDDAASFVVDLLEHPASEIHVLEGQVSLDEALVVPGHPDAFELGAVDARDPGTVWAVDGGSCAQPPPTRPTRATRRRASAGPVGARAPAHTAR